MINCSIKTPFHYKHFHCLEIVYQTPQIKNYKTKLSVSPLYFLNNKKNFYINRKLIFYGIIFITFNKITKSIKHISNHKKAKKRHPIKDDASTIAARTDI